MARRSALTVLSEGASASEWGFELGLRYAQALTHQRQILATHPEANSTTHPYVRGIRLNLELLENGRVAFQHLLARATAPVVRDMPLQTLEEILWGLTWMGIEGNEPVPKAGSEQVSLFNAHSVLRSEWRQLHEGTSRQRRRIR